MSTHWASASLSWLLLECSFPWDKDAGRDGGSEAASYGSAFHAMLAHLLRGSKLTPKIILKIAEKHGVKRAADELKTHVMASHVFFTQWLRGRNEFNQKWDVKHALIEQAVGLQPLKGGRIIDPHDEEHRYLNLRPGELPGTLDYANKGKLLLVIDHKTGEEDFSEPTAKPQLLTLAIAMMRLTKRTECAVGVLHARRRGLPKIYIERVQLHELEPFEQRLAQAILRIGDGSMRPGKWCERCPMQSGCPARDAKLLERAGGVLGELTQVGGVIVENRATSLVPQALARMTAEQRDGILYEIARLAENMSDRIRHELRAKILDNPGYLPELRAGGYLVIREYDRENISKSSVLEALGRVAGEKELTRLRAAGAITKKKVVQLHMEKERGR